MLSKSSQYAIRAVLYIAVHQSERKKIRVEEVAQELEIPKYYLAKILRRLTGSDIMESIKGPGGGYYLESHHMQKSLMSIIAVMEEQENLKQCALGLRVCSSERPCPVHHLIVPYRNALIAALEKSTVASTLELLEQNESFIENLFAQKMNSNEETARHSK